MYYGVGILAIKSQHPIMMKHKINAARHSSTYAFIIKTTLTRERLLLEDPPTIGMSSNCKQHVQRSIGALRYHTVAYLLKATTVEPEKQPLLGNGYVTRNDGVTVGSGVLCAVRAEAI
jgi:hypothetical protein